MKFSYSYGRLSSRELPMVHGQYAIKFIEDESGKPFDELMSEFLSPKDKTLREIEELNNVLGRSYIVYMEVHSVPTDEDLKNINIGIQQLDRKSFDYRDAKATTDVQKLKEARQRIYAGLRVVGPQMIGSLEQEFDTVNYDLGDSTIEDIEKNVVGLIEITQRLMPTTFIISNELSGKLKEENTLCKTLNNQVSKAKNVFAERPESNFVRSL